MISTINGRALLRALLATAMLVAAVLVGSRNLGYFDDALVAYLFGTIFAVFAITYRYSVWLQRPPTHRYWTRSLEQLFSRRFLYHMAVLARATGTSVVAQRFIFRRGVRRGIAHMLIAWGCLSAFAITLPLTFGWLHFTLAAPGIYETHVFGFPVFRFLLGSPAAFFLFHALNFSSVMVLAGAAYYLRRRITDAGQIATQTFEMDWMPLVLLVLISLSGLGITWDYELMRGRAHAFMAITHAIAVILFLVWLPFGKFFHIFQRPAQLGISIYRDEGARGPQQVCSHTNQPFASALQVGDLKEA